jgi:hypothetical protein
MVQLKFFYLLNQGQPNIPSYSTAKNLSLLDKLECPVLQSTGGQMRCRPPGDNASVMLPTPEMDNVNSENSFKNKTIK